MSWVKSSIAWPPHGSSAKLVMIAQVKVVHLSQKIKKNMNIGMQRSMPIFVNSQKLAWTHLAKARNVKCSIISIEIETKHNITQQSTQNLTVGCSKGCIGRLKFKLSSQHPTVVF